MLNILSSTISGFGIALVPHDYVPLDPQNQEVRWSAFFNIKVYKCRDFDRPRRSDNNPGRCRVENFRNRFNNLSGCDMKKIAVPGEKNMFHGMCNNLYKFRLNS
jgi:hypothetical protein